MILVGTSGVSLSIYRLLDNGLFNGQRNFFGLFREPTGMNTLQWISRVGGALSILADPLRQLEIVTLQHPPV
jgi:hypothetical protein